MSKNIKSGQCLCGAVKVSAVIVGHDAGVCHCKMCQRWSAGPNVTIHCSSETTFEGEDAISVYSSSPWGERGFCKHCGSSLFWRSKQEGSYYLSVGVLDDTEGLTLANEIFIDKKPALYSFAEPTNKMTEAEFMSMFSAPTP